MPPQVDSKAVDMAILVTQDSGIGHAVQAYRKTPITAHHQCQPYHPHQHHQNQEQHQSPQPSKIHQEHQEPQGGQGLLIQDQAQDLEEK